MFVLGALLFSGLALLPVFMGEDLTNGEMLTWVIGVGLIVRWFLVRLYLDHFRESPWQVRLKIGGMLADEVFSNHNQEWAEKFSQAVSYALSVEQHRRSGGTQPLPPPPIFPPATFSRN